MTLPVMRTSNFKTGTSKTTNSGRSKNAFSNAIGAVVVASIIFAPATQSTIAHAASSKSQSTAKISALKESGPNATSAQESEVQESETKTAPITVSELDTPEPAIHDSQSDVYLVSNIGGALPVAATAKDGNGFISKIGPDGIMIDRTWIGLGKNGVRLNAPKGLALSGRGLFVADVDVVHQFDRRSGALIRSITIPGATFLNDVTSGPNGSVYVSDTGLTVDAQGKAFIPTNADAVYQIKSTGQVATIVKDPALLAKPNGLTVDRFGRLLVVSFDDSKEVSVISRRGTKDLVRKLPVGQLDGIEVIERDSYVISSFENQSVVRVKRNGTVIVEFTGKQAADIGIDRKRRNLLLPLIIDNALVIQPLGTDR